MDIYPQDLGEKLCAKVFVEQEPNVEYAPAAYAGLIGFVALLCSIVTLLMLANQTDGVVWAILSDVILTIFYVKAAFASKPQSEDMAQPPLNDLDVAMFHNNLHDPLEGDYLKLVAAIIRTEMQDDAATAHEVRQAVRALGAAIENLPAQDAAPNADNPAALQEEAQHIAAQADAEPDSVIRASLQRRVASLTHRAVTAERTDLLLRRNAALRAEVAEQMEALHTSLTALKVGATQGAGELAGLAASIQSVASAANAITGARAEVDSYLHVPEEQTITRQ